MAQEKTVIYEKSSGWRHPYEVEVQSDSHWAAEWEYDSSYTTPESAVANAERLLTERGVYRVRVIHVEDSYPED